MNFQIKNQTKGKSPPGGSGIQGNNLVLNADWTTSTKRMNSKVEFYQMNQ